MRHRDTFDKWMADGATIEDAEAHGGDTYGTALWLVAQALADIEVDQPGREADALAEIYREVAELSGDAAEDPINFLRKQAAVIDSLRRARPPDPAQPEPAPAYAKTIAELGRCTCRSGAERLKAGGGHEDYCPLRPDPPAPEIVVGSMWRSRSVRGLTCVVDRVSPLAIDFRDGLDGVHTTQTQLSPGSFREFWQHVSDPPSNGVPEGGDA